MQWTLIVLVLGVSPVKTGLVFDSLDECLSAETAMRSAYADAFNKWQNWAKANPSESGYPGTQPYMQKRIGLNNGGTCIPYSPPG